MIQTKYYLIFFGVLFFGFLIYSRIKRQQDQAWIKSRFSGVRPIIVSFGVKYFGLASDHGPIKSSSGFLLIFPDLLFFKSNKGLEWSASAEAVTGVDHDTNHRGRDLKQSIMVVDFINPEAQPDRAAFRVPYPPQWIKAIDRFLVSRRGKGNEPSQGV